MAMGPRDGSSVIRPSAPPWPEVASPGCPAIVALRAAVDQCRRTRIRGRTRTRRRPGAGIRSGAPKGC